MKHYSYAAQWNDNTARMDSGKQCADGNHDEV